MTRADQIYPLDRGIKRELKKAENDLFNKDVIIRYYKARTFEITKASMLLYLTRLNRMSHLLGKGFEDATIEDMENLVFEITKLPVADSTKNRTIKILKVFYRWLKKCPKGQFPPEVSWITTKKTSLVTVKSEDLVPFEECVKIAEHATNLRDKALFLCTLDAGCRIGEILTVRIGEVNLNDYGAVLNSDGKTGEGPLILTWSTKTLVQWINNHPFGNDKNAPLFPKLGSSKPEQLSYQGARLAFKKCVRRAGYGNRRVWLHLFKHVSCTWDYLRGMPQSYRNFKHHWSSTSEMGKVYEHLSNSVIPLIQTWNTKEHEKINEKDQNSKEVKLTSTCKRCEFENPRDSKYCNRCAFSLDDGKNAELVILKSKTVELLNKLNDKPEKLEKVLEILDAM